MRLGQRHRLRVAVRAAELRSDPVEDLPANLFYGTGLAACVMVLRQRKAPERQGKLLVVDASTLFTRGRNQNTLANFRYKKLLKAEDGAPGQKSKKHGKSAKQLEVDVLVL